MDIIYYTFGDYLYNYIRPNITGNVEIFKYILGKIYIDYLFPLIPLTSIENVTLS